MSPSGKKKLHRILLAGLALVALSAVAMAGRSWLARGALVGDSRHDFGVVPFEGRQVEVEHTFVLTNRTGSDALITAIKPSCGCTTTEQDTDVVEPGGDLNITAKLLLTITGEKKSKISITYEHDGETKTRVLFLRGAGRKLSALGASRTEVRIPSGPGASVTLFREMVGTVEPPPPIEIEISPGFDVEQREWKMRSGSVARPDEPVFWTQRITITLADPPPAARGTLRVEQADDQVVEIALIPMAEPESPAGSPPDDR